MLTTEEILHATKGRLIQGQKNTRFLSISTDSRTINKDSLFIPLIGTNYDGHTFIQDAISKGCKGIVTSKTIPKIPSKVVYIKVNNTLLALQNIARYHRLRFKIPIVGITGSSGKTTTKDMIASILSRKGKTLKTNENYNNEIGVPLTFFNLDKSYKAAVIEMAMQNIGEIEEVVKIALPNIAVITNVGEAHLEMLKTKEAIARAKSEILKYLNKKDVAVLPADDVYFPILKRNAKKCKVITFGIKNKADIRASGLKANSHTISFTLEYENKKYEITLPLPGTHNIYNALAAIAVAKALHISIKNVITGLEKFTPSSKRMDIFVKNNIRIINDTYNANPSSMRAALEVLRNQGPVIGTTPPRRIAVIGDMLELGKKATQFHKKIGKIAAKYEFNRLIAVGNLTKHAADEAIKSGMKKTKVFYYPTKEKAIQKLKQIIRPNDVILVKGSRGMRMEEVVEKITPPTPPQA